MNRLLSLQHISVLNTRPWPQGLEFSQQIIALGGQAFNLPLLEITPVAAKDWLKVMPVWSKVEQIIFISANAVHYFFRTLQLHGISWPKTIPVIGIGKATATQLSNFGLTNIIIPIEADSEHLIHLPCLQDIKNKLVVLVKGKDGRTLIKKHLVAQGAIVNELSVYQRQLPILNTEYVKKLWQENTFNSILITSELSLKHLFMIFPDSMHAWLRTKLCIVISQRLAVAVKQWGFTQYLCCKPHLIIEELYS